MDLLYTPEITERTVKTMSDQQQLHTLAAKWNPIFRDTQVRCLEEDLGEDCERAGLSMDRGQAFREQFGDRAFYQSEGLGEIIEEVRDESMLASAIYAKWHFLTLWSQEDVLSPENRSWFQMALYRLSVLTCGGWKQSWVRQAQKENPVLQRVMMKTLEDYLKQHPEG